MRAAVWTADIDVGGTLTDGVFSDGERIVCVKAVTTPHDLTVCLFDCLAQAAAKLEFDGTTDFLEHVELIRWSTTITSNVLAELRGPRVGLLLSAGHERDLYGTKPRSDVFDRFLSENDVIGLVDEAGESEIMVAARTLLEIGVRRICVSLNGGVAGPAKETLIKRTIEQQYPDHFLGSVPVLAGSDISKSKDAQTRTYCALINAYTHGALAATLFKAEDELRQTSQYSGTFLVSHVNGGVAGIAKTKAIDTIESGPMLGIRASSHLAKVYGINDLVAMDIGGTTAKISLLRNGEPIYRRPSDFFGTRVDIRLPDLHSIAVGGGSVVKPIVGAKSPTIQLGPESMGSYPGPACYALGGDQPTLTDAFVTAGLINPEYFLEGTKHLDRDLARQCIEDAVAGPLNVSTEEACAIIIDRAFETVAELILRAAAGCDFSRHVLFAYGGNGGLFACGVADKAGIARAQVFSLGPVFSALGSSVSDISHVYERRLSGATISDRELAGVREVLEQVKAEAVKDLLGEGVKPDDLTYAVELEITGDRGESAMVRCPETALGSTDNLQATLPPADQTTGWSLELIRVHVRKAMPKPKLIERSVGGSESSHARQGTRPILWGSRDGRAETYRWELLEPGNRVDGCAIVEAANTTYFIPEGWVMIVDRFGNGTLTRATHEP